MDLNGDQLLREIDIINLRKVLLITLIHINPLSTPYLQLVVLRYNNSFLRVDLFQIWHFLNGHFDEQMLHFVVCERHENCSRTICGLEVDQGDLVVIADDLKVYDVGAVLVWKVGLEEREVADECQHGRWELGVGGL